jgi:FkbM family methyltransferase
VARPFDDAGALVVKTSDREGQGLYECLHHSAAVVGLNTSAELEAAIVGKPVYTVIAGDESADGQSSTLHFHYLLEEQGGCVRRARDLTEHAAQLRNELETPRAPDTIRRFAGEFLRPHGLNRPIAPLLAEAIERTVTEGRAPEREPERTVVPDGPEAEHSRAINAAAGGLVVALTHPKYEYALHVHTSPKSHADGFRLEKGTVEWLQRDVGVGDVVYDIDCGVGAYAMLAAKYHGAVAMAFEPGYAAFRALCDNLRLNGCDGSVMPMSLALADFEGIAELKYPSGHAGWKNHGIKPAPWRVRRSSGTEGTFKVPVYAMMLDQVVPRFALPMPQHLRLGNPTTVERVLGGATDILQSSSLKTIVFALPEEASEELTARLATMKWYVTRRTPMKRGQVHVVLARFSDPASSGESPR